MIGFGQPLTVGHAIAFAGVNLLFTLFDGAWIFARAVYRARKAGR